MSDPVLPLDGCFDRDLSAEELLPPTVRTAALQALTSLLGDCQLLTQARPGAVPVRHEIETLFWLWATAPTEQLTAAAALLELLMRAEARYRMASTLHLEALRHDFDELTRRNEALVASEARYRDLASHLEQRVAAQVQQIEQTQRQLFHAEKMVSLGQLAAGVAHEINNPLGFIRSNLNSARGYLEELAAPLQGRGQDELLEDFAALLRESIEGADRVAHIVASLKDFSGVDGEALVVADLNQVIEQVLEVSHSRLAGITLQRNLQPLPKLRCHAANLGQVVLQLLLNAVDAVAPGGVIRITSALRDGQITLAVLDNGAGIAPEHLSRIFDPFFTTKPVGSGAGLGLTVSNDIVHAHGGHIAVESRLGAGTQVRVTLPLEGS